MEMHYEVVQKQIYQMESSQKTIDAQMHEIGKIEEEMKGCAEARRKISAYLAGLQQSYESLCAGMYCDDWMLDAVLYTQSELLKRQGINFDCSMQDYERGSIAEADLVKIFLALLDFAIGANQKQQKDKVQLKAASVRNQLIIEFVSGCERGYRLSRRIFSPYIERYQGTVEIKREAHKLRFMLALQKG